MLTCTACPKGSDAEGLHTTLRVPICGACTAQLKDADVAIVDNQMSSCAWCGCADYVQLLMCDTCVKSFCYDCVERNFGKDEAKFVKDLEVWSCYVCNPTSKFKALQVNDDISYFNIDRAYAAIRPPSVQTITAHSAELFGRLTAEEKFFASLISNSIHNVSIQDSDIITKYLTAIDLAAILRVSSGLRKLFQSKVHLIPGLFKTLHGEENQCKLFSHQIVSLNRMIQIENRDCNFGDLRGGIFGDEPGLGKTVTTLALIASTAGVLPQQPSVFWDKETINAHWQQKKGQFEGVVGAVLQSLQKCTASGLHGVRGLADLRRNIEKHCATIKLFESTGNEF